MRSVCVVLCAFVLACGSNSSSNPDSGGGGGDDGGVDPTGDGGGSGGPHTVKLTLTNRPNNAAPYSFFVAYQDGSAPWTMAPAPSGDTYSFEISAPVYGVAWGCIGNVTGTTTTQLRTVNSAHFAVAERTELSFDVPARCSDRFGDGVTLSGTITNRPTTGVLIVQFGGRSTFVGPQSGAFTLQTQPGTHDLVIIHAVPLGNGEYYSDESLVVRDLAVTAATTRTIDFGNSDYTQYFNVDASVPNLGARIIASTTLYTANGTSLAMVRESQNWESNALAESQVRTTDVYDQSIAVTTAGASATVTNATNAPSDQTYVAPAPLGAVMSMVATKMPYPIVQTTWPAYASAVGYAWNTTQQLSPQQCGGNVGCTVVWTAVLSPGVTGATPGYRMPDLSGVAGWKAAFQLVNGAQVVGGVTAQTSSAGAGDFPPGVPANGTKRVFVRSDFGVTP
jgi:hypothetical protein